jgi:WD domain, G-beta repeat
VPRKPTDHCRVERYVDSSYVLATAIHGFTPRLARTKWRCTFADTSSICKKIRSPRAKASQSWCNGAGQFLPSELASSVATGSVDQPDQGACGASCREGRPKHSDWIWSVAFSPDGTVLASAGSDGNIILWRLAEAEPAAALGP